MEVRRVRPRQVLRVGQTSDQRFVEHVWRGGRWGEKFRRDQTKVAQQFIAGFAFGSRPVPVGAIDHGRRASQAAFRAPHFAIRVSSCPSIKWAREKSGDAKKDIQVVVTGHIVFAGKNHSDR